MTKVISGMFIGIYQNDDGTKRVEVNTLTKYGREKKVEKKDPPTWTDGDILIPPAEVINYVEGFLREQDLD